MATVKPTARQRKAVDLMRAGMDAKQALLAAGYSGSTVHSQFRETLTAPGMVAAALEHAKEMVSIVQPTAAEQEHLVRVGLIDAAIRGEHAPGSLRAYELLGKDKRVGMFQPDVLVGVQVNIDSAPDPNDPQYS